LPRQTGFIAEAFRNGVFLIAAGMHIDDELYGSFLKQVNES